MWQITYHTQGATSCGSSRGSVEWQLHAAGSTGVSLAMMAAACGCRCRIAMPDDAAAEKAQILEALGATVQRMRPVSITHPGHFVNVARRVGFPLNPLCLTAQTRARLPVVSDAGCVEQLARATLLKWRERSLSMQSLQTLSSSCMHGSCRRIAGKSLVSADTGGGCRAGQCAVCEPV